jgi:hypothetical protein
VNVPVVLDDVDELESPLPPQETTIAAMQRNKAIEKNFFIFNGLFDMKLP